MKKYDIFTFSYNGREITAIVVDETHKSNLQNGDLRLHTYLCYGFNKLFKYCWLEGFDHILHNGNVSEYQYIGDVVKYAVLPDYDEKLTEYKKKQSYA